MPDNRNRPKQVYEETPWNYADKISPNGKYSIEFTDAGEIGMGGPWSANGTLVNITRGMRKLISRECGGPAVWSTDSRYLAVPVFVDRTDQKLAIVDAATGEIRLLPESVMLLTLKSFDGKTVVGIKWKVNGEQPVSIDITSLIKR